MSDEHSEPFVGEPHEQHDAPDSLTDADSYDDFRYQLVGLGDTEDLERYEPGGLHPVHLGDVYDDRYRIVHKLGNGGFSTVWLAAHAVEAEWVALKFVVADHSTSVEAKSLVVREAISDNRALTVGSRHFTVEGPNGRHTCQVLPVLGPSANQLSHGLSSRMRPWLARSAGFQAVKALACLHAQNLCHGDATTANIVFKLSNIDEYTEPDVVRVLGEPVTAPLELLDGGEPGPEAPRYIVKALDFVSTAENIIEHDVSLIDFDLSFPAHDAPDKMLGTPVEFLAPEVAVGEKASPASDVWALGCAIFRMRAGECPFTGYEVTSPGDLMRAIVSALGDMPSVWMDVLWDYDGQPTRDPAKGDPFERLDRGLSLRDLVYQIYDEPENGGVETGTTRSTRPDYETLYGEDIKPFAPCFSSMFWKPTVTKIDNVCLGGYDGEIDELLEAMLKIPKAEAKLLYNLLSKIFVYDPKDRISATELLAHPWFQMDRGPRAGTKRTRDDAFDTAG